MKEYEKKGFGLRAIFLTLLVILLLFGIGIAAVFFLSGNSPEEVSGAIWKDKGEAGEPKKLEENYTKELKKLNQKLKDAEAELTSLEKMLDSKEQEASKSEYTIAQLESTMKNLEESAGEKNQAAGEMIATYEHMAPKRAALILQEMKEDEAAKVLSAVTTEARAAILEKMDPALAAPLMVKISAEAD